MHDVCGPLWAGKLWDSKLADSIAQNKLKLNLSNEERKILDAIKEESKINWSNAFGFLDMHAFGRTYKKNLKISDAIELLSNNKINVSRTHFTPYGIRGVDGVGLNKLVNGR